MTRRRATALLAVLALVVVVVGGWAVFTKDPPPTELGDVRDYEVGRMSSPTTFYRPSDTLPSVTDTTGRATTTDGPRTSTTGPRTTASQRPTTSTPQAGVPDGIYRYKTEGSETVHLGPGSTHTYPDETLISYLPGGCGFVASWSPIEGRRDLYNLCVEPFAIDTYEVDHAHFGQTDHRDFYCDPPMRLDVSGTGVCWQAEEKTKVDRRVSVTREPITVAGETFQAMRVQIRDKLSGEADGEAESEWWFLGEERRDLWLFEGLVLRAEVHINTDASTILGNITYTEDVVLELMSTKSER